MTSILTYNEMGTTVLRIIIYDQNVKNPENTEFFSPSFLKRKVLNWSPTWFSQIEFPIARITPMHARNPKIHSTRVFISLSMLVLLNFVLPLFCINLVSGPANITIPKHQLVFLRMQPLRIIFSLLRECLLPFQERTPVNLSNLLLGASQTTVPSNFASLLISAPSSEVTDSAWRTFRFVSLWN